MKKRSIKLIEWLVVAAIVALLVAFLLPEDRWIGD